MFKPQSLVSQNVRPEALNLHGFSSASRNAQALSKTVPATLPATLNTATTVLTSATTTRSTHRHIHTAAAGAGGVLDPLELTSIETVMTPNPPPAKTPPSAKSVYRVGGGEGERERLEGAGEVERGAPPAAAAELEGEGVGDRLRMDDLADKEHRWVQIRMGGRRWKKKIMSLFLPETCRFDYITFFSL